MEQTELQRAIEAILFAAGEPVEISRLAFALECDEADVADAADALANTLAYERRGIRVLKLENAYQMVSSGEMADFVTKALDDIAERNQRQLPPPTANFKGIVGKERYPVGRKTGELLRRLLLRGVEKLKNLFKGNKSRSEIVATFISVLEMCKTGSVRLEGDVSGENPDVRLVDESKVSTEVTTDGTN